VDPGTILHRARARRPRCGNMLRMALRVLEFVRDPEGVWNLPAHLVEQLRRDFPGVRFDAPATRPECDRLLPEAEVVLGWAVTRANFATARRLRWVHVTAAGVGHALFPELAESDVLLTNSRGLHAPSMAEHALGVMLAFCRKLHRARDAQHERRWVQSGLWTEAAPFRELAGSTLGLVGLGAVGSAIAVRARALGLTVLAVRRHPAADPAPAHEQWGVERLPELLERSDWVVLAAPLTAATHGLIGPGEIARMKRDAVLVNLGRGRLVDQAALTEALVAGRIAGAALDVFEREPLPADSPLWTLPQVIVTPHISGLGSRLWERAVELFARNLRAFVAGEPLVNVVDKRAGY
jgi:D-2-hydroxyacid dehydrogenase (NADP+)